MTARDPGHLQRRFIRPDPFRGEQPLSRAEMKLLRQQLTPKTKPGFRTRVGGRHRNRMRS